ncbi:MAG: iron-containing alcohol dehydrogenase [Lachnospiraceae bacterium]|nr:iron-containing alcohol dehydrogenase [Lachnospiraceae bacterium]
MLELKTKIYFDEDIIKKNTYEFSACGKKALIVTGHSSEKNGALKDVEDVLNSQNILFEIFNDVEENPSIETVMSGRDFGLKNSCDFLIAIGGGSIMDAAKAIAIMMTNEDKGADYLYDVNAATNFVSGKSYKLYEIIAIPTTCGSGAEVTGNAVLTIHKNKTKGSAVHKQFPKVALIDGKYILNAPANIIKRTSLDALSHLIESYVNTKANVWTRQFAEMGMSIWAKTKKYLLDKVSIDSDICKYLMMSSTYAGICISHTGTSIPHRLSYRVTYGDKISHGTAVAYFLANFLDECEEKEEVLKYIGFNNIKEFSVFIDKVIGYIKVDKELIEKGIDEILKNEKVLNSVKFKVDKDVLIKIGKI